MELTNETYLKREALSGSESGRDVLGFAIATTASLLFPFAPHLSAEVHEAVTGERPWELPWPKADPSLLVSDTVKLVIQVNGKVRDSIEVVAGTPDDELKRLAAEQPNVAKHLDGKQLVKEIVVPGKLVNLVVR